MSVSHQPEASRAGEIRPHPFVAPESAGLKPYLAFAACAAVATLGAATIIPGIARDRDGSRMPAMQVLADVMLIDRRCRDITADFGALSRYAEAHGIPSSSILPLGRSRQSFETAAASRARMPNEELCTVVAEQAEEAAPGVLAGPRPP